MTLRHLKIFVAVCDEGSVTRAAQTLYMTQPAVSIAVAELEKHYGLHLFDRLNKRLYLTADGERLLQYARHITGLFADMEREVRDLDAAGRLRLGSSITIANCLLPGLLTAFTRTRPQLQVAVTVENSALIQQRLARNELDIALSEGPAESPYLVERPFFEDDLVMLCPVGHPFAGRTVPLAALRDENLILREKGSASRDFLDGLLQMEELRLTPAWQCVSTRAIVKAVQAGFGISILPRLMIRSELARGDVALFSLEGVSLRRRYRILYHQNKFLTPAMEELIRLCEGALPEGAGP